MSSVLARLALAAALVFVLLAVLLLALLPGKGEVRSASTHSTEPEGWRALYLLCEALGFPVAPWSEAPGALTGADTLLVLAELPAAPPGSEHALPGAPRRGRDPGHYRRFVEEGGTLLVFTDEVGALDELRDGLGLAELAELTAQGHVRPELALELAGGERFELAPGAFVAWSGAGLEVLASATLEHFASEARTLDLVDGELVLEEPPEEPPEPAGPERVDLAVRFPLGAGALVLVGLEPELFRNRALEREPGVALLFVRLLERLGPHGRVLFDEYALGAFLPPSRLELLFSPTLAAASLHLAAWFVLFLLAAAWVGPFARDPEPLFAGAPLERARGQGGLLARAGRFDVLAELLRRGLLARWNARAGLRGRGVEPDLALLARGDERWLARARALFLGRAPVDGADLKGLARALSALERELFRTNEHDPAGRRPRPPSTRSP